MHLNLFRFIHFRMIFVNITGQSLNIVTCDTSNVFQK